MGNQSGSSGKLTISGTEKRFLGKKKPKCGVLGIQRVFGQGGEKTVGHGLSCTHCGIALVTFMVWANTKFEPTSSGIVRHCTSREGLVWCPLVQELNEAMFANTAPC